MWDSPVIPLLVMFGSVVYIIKLANDYRIKKMLIEKGLTDDKVKVLLGKYQNANAPSSLKWGMVLIAIGVAIIIGRLIPTYYVEEVTFGAMFLLAGLALLIFYFIAKSKAEE